MKQEWRRGDDPIHSLKVNYGDVKAKPVGIGALHRIPDTNKKKRDDAHDFFAQEKLLIEYWVSKYLASTSKKWIYIILSTWIKYLNNLQMYMILYMNLGIMLFNVFLLIT